MHYLYRVNRLKCDTGAQNFSSFDLISYSTVSTPFQVAKITG
jgi:hypothetical protein